MTVPYGASLSTGVPKVRTSYLVAIIWFLNKNHETIVKVRAVSGDVAADRKGLRKGLE